MKRRVVVWAMLAAVAGWGSGALAGSFEDFFTAIRQDDVGTISRLAARGFDLNTTDPTGQPGLLLAIKFGANKVANHLADHPQAKVDLRNPQNETPLMLAVLKGQLQLAQKLVRRDADVNKEGWAPLHYAATASEGPVAEQLRWLLEQHAYIDAESPNGTTPLMMAAQYGLEESVRVLLREGADATIRNQVGLSAADFAERAGRQHVVKLIAEHVADLNQAEKIRAEQGPPEPKTATPEPSLPTAPSPLDAPSLPSANAVSVPMPFAEVPLQPLGSPGPAARLVPPVAPVTSPLPATASPKPVGATSAAPPAVLTPGKW